MFDLTTQFLYMKKIMTLMVGVATMLMIIFLASCNGKEVSVEKNVFEKMVTAYQEATVKVNAAKEVSELSEINKALEEELDGIEAQCAEELKGIKEKKAADADAFKSDEEAFKEAQRAYDDAYVERILDLGVQ